MEKSFAREKILVALSGGVDSAVAAALLSERGHEVETVYVRTWEHEDDLLGECPGARDLADAQSVSEKLNLPFHVLNLIDFYQKEVVQPMVDGYADGTTPNPDVLCNRRMKFGVLLDHAKGAGFSALATGHYCLRKLDPHGVVQLWEGKDKNKDQSYFLARLSLSQLQDSRFPLGDRTKPEVRDLAKRYELSVAEKKDSQGICFLGKVKIPDFLGHFIEESPGEIVTVDGKVLGRHRGLHRYTIGQRKGIGIPSNTDNENFVVTGKDQETNRLIVAFDRPEETTLWGRKYRLGEMSFLNQELSSASQLNLSGKARYRDPSTPLILTKESEQSWIVEFEQPQRALTPGQVLALYEGERLVGSAIYSRSHLGRALLST